MALSPSRRVRLLDALAALTASGMLGAESRNWPYGAVPAAVALLGLAPREGLGADSRAQLAASLVAGAVPAYLLFDSFEAAGGAGSLDALPATSVLALLGAAAVRTFFPPTRMGGVASSALLLAALMALGQGHVGASYAVGCALALALTLAARRAEEPAAQPGARFDRAGWLALAAQGLLAVALAVAGGYALPRLQARFVPWATSNYGRQEQTGLGDRMGLEALDGILQSDAPAVLVRGGRADYLRGAVFDRYSVGLWTTSRGGFLRTVNVGRHRGGVAPGEVELQRVGGPRGWLLLPQGAGALSTLEGTLRASETGTARADADGEFVWYRPGAPGALTVALPGDTEQLLPRGLRHPLRELAERWGCATGDPAARAACLREHLQREYRYSLRVPTQRGADPVLDFLLRHRQGHCEFFATSLALLARVVEIPSRLVAGYRVHERAPFGDYYIARDRNAHSWTELYLPEQGWVLFDATPSTEVEAAMRPRVSRARALFEVLRFSAGALYARARAAGALTGLIVLLALVLVFSIGRRELRRWREGAAAREQSATAGLLALEAALEQVCSAVRAPGETLERFAARLEGEGSLGEEGGEVTGALREYARRRYGTGDAQLLDEPLRELAAKLRRRRRERRR